MGASCFVSRRFQDLCRRYWPRRTAYEGQINLGTPLSRYLPVFRLKYDGSNQLTVHSGIPPGLPHNANDNLLEAGVSIGDCYSGLNDWARPLSGGRCFGCRTILYSTIVCARRRLGQSLSGVAQEPHLRFAWHAGMPVPAAGHGQ